jgi:hypothetical protein
MSDAANPKPRPLERPTSLTPKVYPATGELALRCIVCGEIISARKIVVFWASVGVAAHITCASDVQLGGLS